MDIVKVFTSEEIVNNNQHQVAQNLEAQVNKWLDDHFGAMILSNKTRIVGRCIVIVLTVRHE